MANITHQLQLHQIVPECKDGEIIQVFVELEIRH